MHLLYTALLTFAALALFPGVPAFLLALAAANPLKTDPLSWSITGAACCGAAFLALQITGLIRQQRKS